MTLNIKDPEAHRLAAAISETTGESMTRVVTDALRERFERLQRHRGKAKAAELLLIAERASTRASRHRKGPLIDHTEYLYDKRGLPK
jgi:antitoxin VapB